MSVIGTTIGATAGSIIPGLGTVAGTAIGGLIDSLSSVFTHEQVYGADFQTRINTFKTWLTKYNLQSRQQYIDPQFINQLLFEDTGWQNDVQQYLAQIQRTLDNNLPIVGTGETSFVNEIVSWNNKLKYNSSIGQTNIEPTPGGQTTIPGSTPIIQSGFSGIGLILIIGVGLFFVFGMKK